MKKILAIVLASAMALSMAACGSSGGESSAAPADSSSVPESSAASDAGDSADGAEIAMITDIGTIDDKAFNQGTWEGVKQYAEEAGVSHKYYKPTEKSTDAYLSAIDLAVKGGAKVIVTPGFLFEEPIFIAQDTYPDVKFILLDGYPNDGTNSKTGPNTVGIKYAEEQSGFLAGYAAVKEGYTKLGFMGGMAVPAVVRYGYGFIQGAEAAAAEVGGIADIQMNYHYTGGFEATPEAQTLAATWYQNGTEVIFACGGAVGNSVMAAAEASEGKKVIGVDVDQSPESKTVLTSAMKALSHSVYLTLGLLYEDKFPGGENQTLDATNGGVELPMATSTFEKFTQADYDAVYAKLVDGSIKLIKDTDDAGNAIAEATDLPVTIVKTTVIK